MWDKLQDVVIKSRNKMQCPSSICLIYLEIFSERIRNKHLTVMLLICVAFFSSKYMDPVELFEILNIIHVFP